MIAYLVWRVLPRRKPPALTAQAPEEAAQTAKGTRLPRDGAKPLTVAGIQHRSDDLRAAMAAKLKRYRADLGDDSIDDDETVELEVAARLQFEDSNVHDPNAVAVLIGQRHVGYVPAGMAPLFRAYVKRKALRGPVYLCDAEVEVEVKSGEPVSMTLMLPPLKT